MDELVMALGPAFAAGFALQQFLEIISPVLDKFNKEDYKKIILKIVSLVAGLLLAFVIGLRVLQPLGVANAGIWDGIVTAFIISAGTEGINSIMKFLGYTKEDKKASAADKRKKVDTGDLQKLSSVV